MRQKEAGVILNLGAPQIKQLVRKYKQNGVAEWISKHHRNTL